MRKGQLPELAELTRDQGHHTGNTGIQAILGRSPRTLRLVTALMHSPKRREELDRIAGASNSPELVRQLRGRGFTVPCVMVSVIDRDGREVKAGEYSLSDRDKAILRRWLPEHKQATKGVQ